MTSETDRPSAGSRVRPLRRGSPRLDLLRTVVDRVAAQCEGAARSRSWNGLFVETSSGVPSEILSPVPIPGVVTEQTVPSNPQSRFPTHHRWWRRQMLGWLAMLSSSVPNVPPIALKVVIPKKKPSLLFFRFACGCCGFLIVVFPVAVCRVRVVPAGLVACAVVPLALQ